MLVRSIQVLAASPARAVHGAVLTHPPSDQSRQAGLWEHKSHSLRAIFTHFRPMLNATNRSRQSTAGIDGSSSIAWESPGLPVPNTGIMGLGPRGLTERRSRVSPFWESSFPRSPASLQSSPPGQGPPGQPLNPPSHSSDWALAEHKCQVLIRS